MYTYTKGIQVDESCRDKTIYRALKRAIVSARILAQAGLAAARDTDSALFDTFFFSTERETLITAYTNVLKILTKMSDFPVVMFCADPGHMCVEQGNGTPAYIGHQWKHRSYIAPIYICPAMFLKNVPRPDPCDEWSLNLEGDVGGKSHGHILLHELVHVQYIAGPDILDIGDCAFGAYAARVMRTKTDKYGDLPESLRTGCKHWDPSENTESYAVLALWFWIRKQQQKTCPQHYPLWNLVKKLEEDEASPNDKSELRRLLTDGEPSKGIKGLSDQQIKNAVNGSGLVDIFTGEPSGPQAQANTTGPVTLQDVSDSNITQIGP